MEAPQTDPAGLTDDTAKDPQGGRLLAQAPATGPTARHLRAQSDSRVRAYLLVLFGNVPIGLLTLLASRSPRAAWVGAAGIALVTLALLLVRYIARHPERDPHRTRFHLACVLVAASALPLIVFYGVYMTFLGTMALVLLLYCQQAPVFWALLVTLTVAVPHCVMQVAMTAGAIPDIGVLTADGPLRGKILSLWGIASTYGLSLLLGQLFRRRHLRTVAELEEAARQVALREVLLREARLELEQAAGGGMVGRFTEQRLGSYELGRILARGGMGEIYEAHHAATGEGAVVKVIRRPEGPAADIIPRFVREAEIAASIDSPHVVKVLEIGGAEAILPFIAMERLWGADLGAILQDEQRLEPTAVVDMVTQIGSGLDAARRLDVVHRDIKPRNLFRCVDGTWKILDFGVARLSGSSGMTGTGLVGTPGYMAPEQVRGEPVDHRCDVHALALVAFRAMTGRPAFAGRDVAEILHQVAFDLPPRPSSLVRMPLEVDDVLRVALAKNPAERFATAVDLAVAFADASEGRCDPALRDRAHRLCLELPWHVEPSNVPG